MRGHSLMTSARLGVCLGYKKMPIVGEERLVVKG